ncbi:Nitrogen metabolite repression protein nmr [Lachnellula cervina]|uniref:Nitrogen metabolite repression protein nmr n=1 Tax=Lachnellula cervina TaxID=1316786 RepID=A0A7D8UL30_9HELO|nr:Nitrogen metabolite repression protein nmr [Lachnellula cervina]
MPSATSRSALTIRPRLPPASDQEPPPRKLKHRPCTSLPDNDGFLGVQAVQSPRSPYERPAKRPMPSPNKTIAVVNASGRQAASFIRVAAAVGYNVRAQLRNLDGIVASEISSLQNVTVLVGDLYTKASPKDASPPLGAKGGHPNIGVNHDLIAELFRGAQLAFINTTFWGDEIAIGRALADAAVKANVQHYIYSSMPNYSIYTPLQRPSRGHPFHYGRPKKRYPNTYNLSPLSRREQRTFTPAYTTIISPPFPPFHPNVPLPWLDTEHDVGPAVLQIFKDGPQKWGSKSIPLAYEMLSPVEACAAFSRGVGRKVRYKRGDIDIKVKIPDGYREQLVALEELYQLGKEDGNLQPFYFGTRQLEERCPEQALALWEGPRGLEEYAREVFPLEEAANGATWMNESEDVGGVEDVEPGDAENGDSDDDDDDDGLVMGGGIGATGENTPARREESWLA